MHSFKIFLFVVLGLLPNFAFIDNYEQKLRNEILPKRQEQQSLKINIPQKKEGYTQITSNSSAALFVDQSSGEILFEKNKDKKVQIASLTKMMTALIVVQELDQNKVITVTALSPQYLDATMGLAVGDKIKISELLHGLLIPSGSDAAQVLAKEVAGSETAFVKRMNNTAALLGLTNTHFSNVVGYDSPENYSTAEDLAKLAKIVLINKQISTIVAKKSYIAKSESGKKYYLTSTNELLGPSFKGVKTGTTMSAGECLVSLYIEEDRKVLGVLLSSPRRFTETEDIIRCTRDNFLW